MQIIARTKVTLNKLKQCIPLRPLNYKTNIINALANSINNRDESLRHFFFAHLSTNEIYTDILHILVFTVTKLYSTCVRFYNK